MDALEAVYKMAKEEAESGGSQGKIQVIAARTASGKLHCKAIGGSMQPGSESLMKILSLSELDSFLEEVSQNQDDYLEQLVCLWIGGDIDVPAYDFRKRLCERNSANRETEILLRGADGGFVKKRLKETLKN